MQPWRLQGGATCLAEAKTAVAPLQSVQDYFDRDLPDVESEFFRCPRQEMQAAKITANTV